MKESQMFHRLSLKTDNRCTIGNEDEILWLSISFVCRCHLILYAAYNAMKCRHFRCYKCSKYTKSTSNPSSLLLTLFFPTSLLKGTSKSRVDSPTSSDWFMLVNYCYAGQMARSGITQLMLVFSTVFALFLY